MATGPDGRVYAAVASGRLIVRVAADGRASDAVRAHRRRATGLGDRTPGPPDRRRRDEGPLAITPTRQVQVLVDRIDGQPLRFADAVIVAADGRVRLRATRPPALAQPTGAAPSKPACSTSWSSRPAALSQFDPATGRTRVLARRLSFTNGVALSSGPAMVFAGNRPLPRLWKIARPGADGLDANRRFCGSPLASVFAGQPARLPRQPDARRRRPHLGGFHQTAQRGWSTPWRSGPGCAKVTLRLPRAWWPVPKAYGRVVAFTGTAASCDLGPERRHPETTAITEAGERWYVQNLHAHTLGWLPRPLEPWIDQSTPALVPVAPSAAACSRRPVRAPAAPARAADAADSSGRARRRGAGGLGRPRLVRHLARTVALA